MMLLHVKSTLAQDNFLGHRHRIKGLQYSYSFFFVCFGFSNETRTDFELVIHIFLKTNVTYYLVNYEEEFGSSGHINSVK